MNVGLTESEPRPRHFSLHVVWTLSVRLLLVASSFLTSIVVAHWLGKEAVGVLAAINVIVATAVQFGAVGLTSASTYFVAQDRKNLAPVALNALLFAPVAGSVMALGVALLARLNPVWFGDVPGPLLTIATLAIPFQLLTVLGQSILLGLRQISRYNALDALNQGIGLINAVVTLTILGLSLYALVLLNTAASVLVSGFGLWINQRALREQRESGGLRPEARLFRRMVRYGLKFQIALVASLLILRADLLIVNYYRGAGEAGVYAVAAQVAAILLLLPNVIGSLLFPRVAQSRDPTGTLTCVVTRHASFVMLLVHLVAVPFCFTLPLLYGAAFADSTVQALILLPGVYLVGIESILVQQFSGTGLPAAIPAFWVVTLMLNVAFQFMFVPSYGARAAAIVSTATYVLIFVLVTFYFRRQTGRSIADIFCLRGSELRKLLVIGPDINGRIGG